MAELMNAIFQLAAEGWQVVVFGLVVIIGLVMLAHVVQGTVAMSTGSGYELSEALLGLLAPVAVGLFLLIATPRLVHAVSTIAPCTSLLADVTSWSERLLAVFVAFRFLKVGYDAVIADAVGAGDAVAALLSETAAIIGAMLVVPFIAAIAAGWLHC